MGALTVTFGANQHVSGLGLTLFLIGARRCVDPATEKGYDVRVDNEHGLITLRRDRDRAEEALPRALIPASPIPDTEQRRSIERFARAYLAGTASPALTEVLERRPPRRTSRASPSAAARSRPRATRTPASRASSSTRATAGRRCSTRSCSSSPGRPGSSHGRTSPGFCDTLIVDEAGQIALADVVAVGHVARNLVFLGDPNQLPQVAQGMQPVQAKASVLQHLLGEETTVPPDRGIFLAETWRLRPELAPFTSDAYYAGRLDYAADRRRRPRRHALQRAGAVPAGARARRRSRRHRGQVPGAGGAVVLVSLAGSSAEDAARGLGFVFNRNRIPRRSSSCSS